MLTLRPEQLLALGEQGADEARDRLARRLRAEGFAARYERAQRELTLTDAAGATTRLQFAAGRVLVESATGRKFICHFDVAGRLTALIAPSGQVMEVHYDADGRIVRAGRQAAEPYRFSYDERGHLRSLQAPDGCETIVISDAEGRALQVSEPGGAIRRYTYTQGGRLARISAQPGGETRYAYDANGTLASVERAAEPAVAYRYDSPTGSLKVSRDERSEFAVRSAADGSWTHIDYAEGRWSKFEYRDRRLVGASSEDSEVSLGYDAAGHLICEQSAGRAVRYERGATGAVLAIIAPDGRRIEMLRDAEQRLTTIRTTSTRCFRLSYEPDGGLAEIQYPNGVTLLRSIGAGSQPVGLRILGADGATTLYRADWGYDVAGRLVAQSSNTGPEERFEYGPDGRLARVFAAPEPGLDRRAGRASARPCDLTRDSHGNITGCELPVGAARLRYDVRSRLIEVLTASRCIRYRYDAIGRRISKLITLPDGCLEECVRYTWAGTLLLEESIMRRNSAPEHRRYVPAPDLGVALAFLVGEDEYCVHHGRRFEALLVTNARGRIAGRAVYEAFGQAVIAGSMDPGARLLGQSFDPETGLHYNGARYYHPGWGEYLQRDPLGYAGGSWDDYAYADGDPLNRADPTGEFLPVLLAGAGIGALLGAGIECYRQKHARPDAPLDWAKIGREAAIGGALGAVAALVGIGLAPLTGALGTGLAAAVAGGALVGGVSGAVTSCLGARLRGTPLSAPELLGEAAIGAGIGAFTAGIGGLAARGLPAARRSIDELSHAAAEEDRGGFTRAGLALKSHGDREGSAFPKTRGNPRSINEQGRKTVDDILKAPGSTTSVRHHARWGMVTEVRAPDGRGVRYDAKGKFMGFLEPNK